MTALYLLSEPPKLLTMLLDETQRDMHYYECLRQSPLSLMYSDFDLCERFVKSKVRLVHVPFAQYLGIVYVNKVRHQDLRG